MEKKGNLEIKVRGISGDTILSPDNYDIKHIVQLLKGVEDMLFPIAKKNRPLISYDIKEGSVLHVFKTSISSIVAFNAILGIIEKNNSIDFLDYPVAIAIEAIQKISREHNYEFQFTTSIESTNKLVINPKSNFIRLEDLWASAELYFYGTVKDAGGKNKANIHLDTKDFGYLTISTEQDFLMEQKENLLYKEFGVRVIGMQNVETGEIDTKTLNLIELVDYTPKHDSDYLNNLILQATPNWEGIDTDEWVQTIRS